MTKISFLIVDDDPVALEVARSRLERLGFEVFTRDRSLGTSNWILRHRPNFVLLDVVMPALTGGELAQVLKKRALGTSIILHSSKEVSELAALVESTGALGALPKGLGESEFAHRVLRFVRQALGPDVSAVGGER